MKLEKLLTLSQFVDYVQSDEIYNKWKIKNELDNLDINTDIFYKECFDLVDNYNNFLKQPLTKEMFVNTTKKPIGYETWLKGNGGADGIACVNWQEAEKKVIFECYICGDYFVNHNCKYNIKDVLGQNKTVHDLAEATDGTLKLKQHVSI